MSYLNKLKIEINTILEHKSENKLDMIPKWIATEVCHSHGAGLVDGEDRDFWSYVGYAEVRAEVTRCINKFCDTTDDADAQPLLPGMKALQKHYVVVRKGQSVGVSIYNMTLGELEDKRDLMQKNVTGLLIHIEEMDRFIADFKETESTG